jgi:hypothetical protein
VSADEQPAHTSGGVPHAYRNAIFWRWAPEMPRELHGGFLKLLYALGTAANTAGKLVFRDGKAIRIQDIARAIGSNEKDTRRYINAAIIAGVLGVEGERKRGRATVYVLVITPIPAWGPAAAYLESTRPKRARKNPPPWRVEEAEQPPAEGESSGAGHPNQEEPKFGSPPPEPTDGNPEGSSGDRHPYEFGSPPPDWFGSPTPEQPREYQVLPHAAAEVVPQPQVDRGTPPETIIASQDQTPPPGQLARCAVCHERMVPRPGRTTHTHCANGIAQRETDRAAAARQAAIAATAEARARDAPG